jgi:S1-C subfamily serine protease
MTHKASVVLAFVCSLASLAGAQQHEQMLRLAYESRNALALVTVTVKSELGDRSYAGQALCVDERMGIFMTLALPTSLQAQDVQEVKVMRPGRENQSFEAKLLGIDFGTGLGFVRATQDHPFEAIAFKGSSDLNPGDPVASVGLLTSIQSLDPYVGMGYVAATLRVPGHMAFLTGGSLTGQCSPVFNAQGKAIGLVGKQLPMQYETQTSRGTARLSMLGLSQTKCFWPIEEFVHVLTNIPVAGEATRPSWIGVAGFNTVSPEIAEVEGIDNPAVSVGKVVPGYAAEEAGLKSGDIIVACEGKPLEDLATSDLERMNFVQRIVRMEAGKKLELAVVRGGRRIALNVQTQPLPKTPSEAPRYLHRPLGLLVRQRVPLEADMDPGAVEGIVVMAVGKNSLASRIGLQNEDVIVQINGRDVTEVSQFKALLESSLAAAKDSGAWPILKVRRGENIVDVQVRP